MFPSEKDRLAAMRKLMHSKLPPVEDANVLERLLAATLVLTDLPDGIKLTAELYSHAGERLFSLYEARYPAIQFQVVDILGANQVLLMLSLKPIEGEGPQPLPCH
jgi:hypothetical protein